MTILEKQIEIREKESNLLADTKQLLALIILNIDLSILDGYQFTEYGYDTLNDVQSDGTYYIDDECFNILSLPQNVMKEIIDFIILNFSVVYNLNNLNI